MSEQNPFAAVKRESLRNDGKKPVPQSERRETAFAPIQSAAVPSDEELRSYERSSEVLAEGLPARNLEPPMAPVRRSRS